MELFPTEAETIEGAGRDLRAGRRSCVDLVEGCLGRIDERDAEVRAWVFVDRDRDGARHQAEALDAELAAGKPRGLLHGIPIGIKDIIDVAGWPTAAGSKRWANRVAERDATLVRRLREAGAILLGKTVTTQYASFDPPVTRNPWNLERTPGGSSSGSAAAVACGMCYGAIGTQTGGSITRPAAYCGVAGCKATYGQVSLAGVLPLAPSLDHAGPIARTVRDLAILLDAIAGTDPEDECSSPRAGTSAYERLVGSEPSPPRLGRLRGLFDERADESMRQALDAAIATLQEAGATVSEPTLPKRFDEVLPRHRAIMAAEAAAWHKERIAAHPDDYLPAIRSLIEEGAAVSDEEYARCGEHKEQLSSEILRCFEGADALIAPAATGPAPDPTTTGDPACNSPISYLGLPTISFPIARSPEGLPLALQLIGRPFGEAELFSNAAWCENVIRRSLS